MTNRNAQFQELHRDRDPAPFESGFNVAWGWLSSAEANGNPVNPTALLDFMARTILDYRERMKEAGK